jgi:hypothetical protein
MWLPPCSAKQPLNCGGYSWEFPCAFFGPHIHRQTIVKCALKQNIERIKSSMVNQQKIIEFPVLMKLILKLLENGLHFVASGAAFRAQPHPNINAAKRSHKSFSRSSYTSPKHFTPWHQVFLMVQSMLRVPLASGAEPHRRKLNRGLHCRSQIRHSRTSPI